MKELQKSWQLQEWPIVRWPLQKEEWAASLFFLSSVLLKENLEDYFHVFAIYNNRNSDLAEHQKMFSVIAE